MEEALTDQIPEYFNTKEFWMTVAKKMKFAHRKLGKKANELKVVWNRNHCNIQQKFEHLRSQKNVIDINVESDKNTNTKLYCICRQKYNSKLQYIQCQQCLQWYHYHCVGVPSSLKNGKMIEYMCGMGDCNNGVKVFKNRGKKVQSDHTTKYVNISNQQSSTPKLKHHEKINKIKKNKRLLHRKKNNAQVKEPIQKRQEKKKSHVTFEMAASRSDNELSGDDLCTTHKNIENKSKVPKSKEETTTKSNKQKQRGKELPNIDSSMKRPCSNKPEPNIEEVPNLFQDNFKISDEDTNSEKSDFSHNTTDRESTEMDTHMPSRDIEIKFMKGDCQKTKRREVINIVKTEKDTHFSCRKINDGAEREKERTSDKLHSFHEMATSISDKDLPADLSKAECCTTQQQEKYNTKTKNKKQNQSGEKISTYRKKLPKIKMSRKTPHSGQSKQNIKVPNFLKTDFKEDVVTNSQKHTSGSETSMEDTGVMDTSSLAHEMEMGWIDSDNLKGKQYSKEVMNSSRRANKKKLSKQKRKVKSTRKSKKQNQNGGKLRANKNRLPSKINMSMKKSYSDHTEQSENVPKWSKVNVNKADKNANSNMFAKTFFETGVKDTSEMDTSSLANNKEMDWIESDDDLGGSHINSNKLLDTGKKYPKVAINLLTGAHNEKQSKQTRKVISKRKFKKQIQSKKVPKLLKVNVNKLDKKSNSKRAKTVSETSIKDTTEMNTSSLANSMEMDCLIESDDLQGSQITSNLLGIEKSLSDEASNSLRGANKKKQAKQTRKDKLRAKSRKQIQNEGKLPANKSKSPPKINRPMKRSYSDKPEQSSKVPKWSNVNLNKADKDTNSRKFVTISETSIIDTSEMDTSSPANNTEMDWKESDDLKGSQVTSTLSDTRKSLSEEAINSLVGSPVMDHIYGDFFETATPDSFTFNLDSTKWEKYISTRKGKRFSDRGWRDDILRQITEQNSCCVLKFIDHYVTGTMFTCSGECTFTDCTFRFKVRMAELYQCVVQCSGNIKHSIKERRARRIDGSLRTELQKDFSLGIKPLKAYCNRLKEKEDDAFIAGNRTGIGATRSVLQKISSEANLQSRKSAGELESWANLSNIPKYNSEGSAETDFIRQFSLYPFYGIGFTVGAVRTFHDLSPLQTVCVDATGSVLQSGLTSKRTYYYELTIKNPVTGKSPLPIAAMVSGDHSLPTITNFFNLLRFYESKLCGGSKRLCIPKQINCDRAWVFILASINVFNKEDYTEYLNRCFRIVTGESNLHDERKTVVHVCTAHIMKDMKKLCLELYPKLVKFGMFFFSLLLNAWTWNQFLITLRAIIIVLNSSSETALTKEAKRELETKINQLNKTDNELTTQVLQCDEHFQEAYEGDDLVMYSEEQNFLKAGSSFKNFFETVIKNVMSEINESHDPASVYPENAYYSPKFWLKIKSSFLPSTPLWSMMMLGDLSRHKNPDRNAKHEHIKLDKTNGLIENRFWVLKNIQFGKKKKLRSDVFFSDLRKDFLGMERQFVDIYLRGVQAPTKPLKEVWGKKGEWKHTRLTYQKAPKRELKFGKDTENKKMSKQNHSQQTKKPQHKSQSDVAMRILPMENYDDNCWFNSVNQMVCTSPQVRNYCNQSNATLHTHILRKKSDRTFTKKISNLFKEVATNENLQFLMEDDLNQALAAAQKRLQLNQDTRQADAHEYLSILAQTYLACSNISTYIDIIRTKICIECGNTKKEEDKMSTLTLSLQAEGKACSSRPFLPDLITNYTTPTVQRTERNCENCNDCHVIEIIEISALPSLLFICLARCVFDYNSSTTTKLTNPIDIPLFVEINKNKYQLHGIINHHGISADSGHYTCSILGTSELYVINDMTVSVEDILDYQKIDSGDSYIVAYTRINDNFLVITQEQFNRVMFAINASKGGQNCHKFETVLSQSWSNLNVLWKEQTDVVTEPSNKLETIINNIVSESTYFTLVAGVYYNCDTCRKPVLWDLQKYHVLSCKNFTSKNMNEVLSSPHVNKEVVKICGTCGSDQTVSDAPYPVYFPPTIVTRASHPEMESIVTLEKNDIYGQEEIVSYQLSFVIINDPSFSVFYQHRGEWFRKQSVTNTRVNFRTIQDECRTSNATFGFYDKIEEKNKETSFKFSSEPITVFPFGNDDFPTCSMSEEMKNIVRDHKGDVKIEKQMLTQVSLKRLLNDEWLNDEIVNSYLTMLFKENPSIGLLDSYTLTQYKRSRDEMIVFAIRSRDTCQKIYSKNAIVIPVHDTKRKHWLLLIVYPKERSIHIFDSLGKPHITDYAELVDHASLFLSAHFAAIDPSCSLDNFLWKVSSPSKVLQEFPRQHDGISCGVFTSIYAKCFLLKCRVNFPCTEHFLKTFRMYMSYELITGSNKITNVRESTSKGLEFQEISSDNIPPLVDTFTSPEVIFIRNPPTYEEALKIKEQVKSIPSLPNEIWAIIIKKVIKSDYSQIGKIRSVNSTFRALARKYLEKVHMHDATAARLLNKGHVSFRTLKDSSGAQSPYLHVYGLIHRHARWLDAWVHLVPDEDNPDPYWYLIDDIYWDQHSL